MKNPPRDSKEYWDKAEGYYPFHARRRIGHPRPESFRDHTQMPYLACPLPGKYSLWGFGSKETAQLFDARYPLELGEDLSFDLLNGQSVVYVCPNEGIARQEFQLFYNHGRKLVKTAEFVVGRLAGFTQTSQVKRGVFIRFTSLTSMPESFAVGTHAIIKSYPGTDMRINGWHDAQQTQDRYLKGWG